MICSYKGIICCGLQVMPVGAAGRESSVSTLVQHCLNNGEKQHLIFVQCLYYLLLWGLERIGVFMNIFTVTAGMNASSSQKSKGIYAGNLPILHNSTLKSTQDKAERQQKASNEIAFWEKQKENLKNRECDTVEEIAQKLNAFHSYEDEIAAVKSAYNNEQMGHILDEAQEQGEKNAEAAKKLEPKTPEERREEMVEEALGTEEDESILDEMLDAVTEASEEILEEQEEILEEVQEEMLEEAMQSAQEQHLEEAMQSAQEQHLEEAMQSAQEQHLEEAMQSAQEQHLEEAVQGAQEQHLEEAIQEAREEAKQLQEQSLERAGKQREAALESYHMAREAEWGKYRKEWDYRV